jgi:hypothetical protein
LLVREYGASEGTVVDIDGEHEELLMHLVTMHASRLGLHVLLWEDGQWEDTD